MAKAARERLARLLAGEEAGAFSAQLSVPSDALHLEVDGVGHVRLPVRPTQAKKLCAVARVVVEYSAVRLDLGFWRRHDRHPCLSRWLTGCW